MGRLSISLLKKFRVEHDGQPIENFGPRKVQELFSYLLLHRDRLHRREELADRLWGDGASPQLKKALRQTLWQLQSALAPHTDSGSRPLLLADSEWIGVDPEADIWLDVATLEDAFAACRGTPGHQLDPDRGQALERAVSLYQGDLLESWYQDWCLYQRERLQGMYLSMLGKLMGYCEANRIFEAGINYGHYILFYDRAHERTHRHLMRLLYFSGDRTGAIRQYQRCVAALAEELEVKPSRRTVTLYHRVREDRLDEIAPALTDADAQTDDAAPSSSDALNQLKRLQIAVSDLQRQVQFAIQAIGVSASHRQG